MKPFALDMTPDSHLIESVVNTKITAPEAISELVDNSFDADATEIYVRISGDSISVSDNGRGCSDLESMLALGRHRRQQSTKLGRYGVGLKNAAIGMGKTLFVSTTHRNVRREAELSWEDIAENGWKSASGEEHEALNESSGTRIEIGKLHRKALPLPLRKELSFSFAPAIWDGKKIMVNDEVLEAWTPPIISNRLEVDEQHDSLPISFHVIAGLTEMNAKEPFILAYEHRIIVGTTMPCKEFNTSSQFIALVTLSGEWALLKHKDGLMNGIEAEWLYDRLNIVCDELLRRVHKMSESVELVQMSAELEDAINVAIGKAKRPNRPGENIVSLPQGTARRVREAANVGESGDVNERGARTNRRGFGIVYCALPNGILGRVDVNGKRVCVQLNELHPFIKQCRAEKNLVALKACAAFLLCNHQSTTTDKSQMVLRFEQETESGKFIEIASSVFSSMSQKPTQDEAAAA
jgi:hypothetical protein